MIKNNRLFQVLYLIFSFSLIIVGNNLLAQCSNTTNLYVCPPNSATLTIVPPAGGDNTTSYTVSSIAYNPDSYTAGIDCFNGSSFNGGDDSYTDTLPIGFNFCFYGNSYSQFITSPNGYITFYIDSLFSWSLANGGYSIWPINYSIPNPLGELNGGPPFDCIMAPWEDLEPGADINGIDLIKYEVLGCAPYRRLVVSWNNVPYFSCTSIYYTGQIKIFESTNVIEIHVGHKDDCNGWNGGYAIEGLHNIDGTQATVASTYNYPNVWMANNEAFRFTPLGGAPTVNWYSGATLVGTGTSINVSPTITTTYTAQLVYSCGGNVAADTFIVNVGDTLPTMGSSPSACTGNSGSAWAIPHGTGPFTYLWIPSAQTGQTASNLAPGVYTVSVTSASGCAAIDTITVGNTSNFAANINSTNELCFGGTTAKAWVTVTTGTAPYTYAWTPTGQTGQTATSLTFGQYTCTVTDASGCSASLIATITEPPALVLVSHPASPAACVVGALGADTVTVTGGTGPFAYLWSPMGGNTATANNLPTGTYTVVVTDANGCTNSSISFITIPGAMSITTSPDVTICAGESTTVSVTVTGGNPGYTYLWNPGGPAGNMLYVSPTVTTTYNVTATDITGCTIVSPNITVTVIPGPIVHFIGGPVNGCIPLTVQFTDQTTSTSPIISRDWDFGDGSAHSDSTNPSHTYYIAGIFDVTLTVTTASGCVMSWTDTAMIQAYPLPHAAFAMKPDTPTIFNPEVNFFNISTNYSTAFWNFGDSTSASAFGNLYHTYPDTGTYWVMLIVFNQYGCSDTATGFINVGSDDAFYIPSAFHPNHQHSPNRYFMGYGVGINEFTMDIFDRWGTNIFHSDSITNPWDGMINGTDAEQGNYTYHIRIVNRNTLAHEYTGRVTLIR